MGAGRKVGWELVLAANSYPGPAPKIKIELLECPLHRLCVQGQTIRGFVLQHRPPER